MTGTQENRKQRGRRKYFIIFIVIFILFFVKTSHQYSQRNISSVVEAGDVSESILLATEKSTINMALQYEKSAIEAEKARIAEEKKQKQILKRELREKEGIKVAYLTFDDGPSANVTPQILDILDKYDIKATFFVVGKTDNYSKDIYRRIVDEGHSLGLHSYSHRYDLIYDSLDNFKYDLYKLQDFLYDVTDYKTNIYRFPGGSGNEVSKEDIKVFIEFLNENNITYFDWNVMNGDASSEGVTVEESYNNVINGVKIYRNSVVLMHDTNNQVSTVESLPLIIETLLEDDFEILPLSNHVKPIQQIEANKIYE